MRLFSLFTLEVEGLTELNKQCFFGLQKFGRSVDVVFTDFTAELTWKLWKEKVGSPESALCWRMAGIFFPKGYFSLNEFKVNVLKFALTLQVPMVTNINFLLTISIPCQEIMLWELMKWSLTLSLPNVAKGKCRPSLQISFCENQIAPCKSTGRELSFEWSHHRISSTDSKVRAILQNSIKLWQRENALIFYQILSTNS